MRALELAAEAYIMMLCFCAPVRTMLMCWFLLKWPRWLRLLLGFLAGMVWAIIYAALWSYWFPDLRTW